MGKGDNSKASFGFLDALLIVFIVLKLCGVINWAWWWVLSPIWLPLAIVLVVAFVIWFKDTFDKPSDHDWLN